MKRQTQNKKLFPLALGILLIILLSGCMDPKDPKQQNDFRRLLCEQANLHPEADGPRLTDLSCTPAGGLDIHAAATQYMADYCKANFFGDFGTCINPTPVANSWAQYVDDNIMVPPGKSTFTETEIVKTDCWDTTNIDGTEINHHIEISSAEDCAAKGTTCEQNPTDEYNAYCKPVPNQTGKWYACDSTSKTCKEMDCDAGVADCSNLNQENCTSANIGITCPAATSTTDCSKPNGCSNAWDVQCGSNNIPTNRADCEKQGFTGDKLLTCPGGDNGYSCLPNNATQFCDLQAQPHVCKSIDTVGCEPKPNSQVSNPAQAEPKTDDTIQCKTDSQGKWGTQCPSGKVCDLEGSGCISNVPTATGSKYDYALSGQDSAGKGLNFYPTSNSDYRYPQFCVPQTNSVFCPTCSSKPSDAGETFGSSKLAITFNKILSKAGTLHFSLASRGLGGAGNYALIQYNDVQDRGSGPQVYSERFVVEVSGSQIGECASENGDFSGDSREKTKTYINYNWNWPNVGMNFCEVRNEYSPQFCDATQFMIALMKRLKEIKDHYDIGTPDEIAAGNALRQFDVYLMQDNWNTDFRNDFDSYYIQDTLVDSWYYQVDNTDQFSKYAKDTTHLQFSPGFAAVPGKYTVNIDITGGTVFFDSVNHNPALTITVGFSQRQTPSSINLNNALYYLPIDGKVGIEQGGNGNKRDGYGIKLDGAQIPMTDNDTTPLVDGTIRATSVQQLTSFSETNNRALHRGKILEISYSRTGTSSVVYSPVIATPVAMKVLESGNPTYGKYQLVLSDGSGYVENGNPPLSTWTGIASTRANPTDPVCMDFQGLKPLSIAMDDSYIPGDQASLRALRFDNPSGNTDKFLVFATVFYTPNAAMGIQRSGDTEALVTPLGVVTGGQTAVLKFTDSFPVRLGVLPKGLKVDNLQELIDLVNTNVGAVCVHTEKTGSGDNETIKTVFYWNRGGLIREVLDKQNTLYSPSGTNQGDVVSGFPVNSNSLCT